MNLAQRLEMNIGKLPADLRAFFETEIASGNELRDVEVGRGPDEGKVAIILYKPFLTKPVGIAYRELKDRDPMLFEYHSVDERFCVLWVKFKPMVLDNSFHGPKSPMDNLSVAKAQEPQNPAEAVDDGKPRRTAKRARENARARKHAKQANPKRAERADATPTSPSREDVPLPKVGEAGKRFLNSMTMTMTFDMWHDGEGYDLEALGEVPDDELEAIEKYLINHQPRDWRDIEALATFETEKARATIEVSLSSTDPKVRREAMRYAADKIDPKDRGSLLLKALESDNLYGGLSEAIDEAEQFHPPAIVNALFRGALNRDGEAAVHFAALLFFIHGKSKEAFDRDHRPLFLRFHATDREERKTVFRELCEIVGVDPKKYVR